MQSIFIIDNNLIIDRKDLAVYVIAIHAHSGPTHDREKTAALLNFPCTNGTPISDLLPPFI